MSDSPSGGAGSGASISISDVSLSIGNNDIISDLNWHIMPNERWGLVGKNGAGKSTLFRAITGQSDIVDVRLGEISKSKKVRMGYLEQKGVSGSTLTVKEEVSSQMMGLVNARNRLEEIEKLVEGGDYSEETLQALSDATVEFEMQGGYTADQKIDNVLKGLGFTEEDYSKSCSEFSGGWQMRIALCRLLLSEPDVLLLDEPTNHLDRSARNWLSDYLSKFTGTLVCISHDEEMLKNACNSICEVRAGRVELYKSRSHDQWLVEREERVRTLQAEEEEIKRKIAHLQEYIDRFGAKTMGATLAQSKMKEIAKLEAKLPKVPIVPISNDEDMGQGNSIPLKFPEPPRGAEALLTLEDVQLRWPGPGVVDAPPLDQQSVIVDDVNFVIERGMRIVVRGPNGAGKSTVLSALSGKLSVSEGARVEGDGLKLGTFTQDLAQDLDQDATGVEIVTNEVRQIDPSFSDEKARSILGSLGLAQEKGIRKVGLLSGGEKARVALARFVMIPSNLLLLDEPSNHLDVATLRRLTGALKNFSGAFLVISHDRAFLEALEPTHVLTVRDGRAILEQRDLMEADWQDEFGYRQQQALRKGAEAAAAVASGTKVTDSPPTALDTDSPTPEVAVMSGEEKKAKHAAQKKASKLEKSLEKYESEVAAITASMYDEENARDSTKLKKLQSDLDSKQAKVDALYLELEEVLENV